MKRLTIVVAITLFSGTLLWVLAKGDLKKFKESVFTRRAVASRFAAKPRALHPAAIYNINLSRAQVSPTDNNQIIITMDAQGDLPGALTLKLERNGSSSAVVGGEWALVVAYTEELSGPPSEDGDSGESLVQKGTLKGTISGGNITLNPDGSIASIDSMQLVVNGGSLTYDTVTDGSGSVQASGLQEVLTSSGSFALSF